MSVAGPPPRVDEPAGYHEPSLLDLDDAAADVPEEIADSPQTQEVAAPALRRVAIAAALAASAAAWMISSIFREAPLPLFVCLLGVAVGVGVGSLAQARNVGLLQYLLLPAAMVAGALVTMPAAPPGQSLPQMVGDAIHQGGLLQAPVDFDPGWRFLLVVIFTVFTGGAIGLASALRQPRLAVAVPLPLTIMAGLVQPQNGVAIAAGVAAGLTLAGLSVAYGAALAGRATTDARFELRRIGRSAGLCVIAVVGLVVINQAGVLFPQPSQSRIVPPTKPTVPPPLADTELFRVKMAQAQPLRLGDLDIYDQKQNAWLLPEFDPSKLVAFSGGPIPGVSQVQGGQTATITIEHEPGHVLPELADTTSIAVSGASLQYDPTTQTVRSTSLLGQGLTYTITAPDQPTGKQLSDAGPPPPSVRQFESAPAPPDQVHLLLLKAPSNLWDRLQYMRTQLYSHVVAKGQGTPVDLPVSRVVEMLKGGDASPYEITAADVLIARWAGVPARIGYGYYPQIADRNPDGTFSVHPREGATWLEVYFSGHGWVPVVGVPAHAVASTNQNPKNNQPIKPNANLAMVVYVTVDDTGILLLYQIVLWWVLVILPFVLAAVLLVVSYPLVLKLWRRRLRQQWALGTGPAARVAVAYAEFRDLARDLAIGDPGATPLEFRHQLQHDPEHEEMAWLVTRALWGDLRRDLRPEDAEAAERLGASLRRRLRIGQPGLYVLLTLLARDSLRSPYWPELPNLWWGAWQTGKPRRRVPALRPAAAAAAAVLALVLAGCGSQASSRQMPPGLAPAKIGDLVFQREPAAEKQYTTQSGSLVEYGRVYSIRSPQDNLVIGSLQLSLYKPGVFATDDIFKDVQSSIGVGHFKRWTVDGQRAYIKRLPDQTIVVWFPPGNDVMCLLVVVAPYDQQTAVPLAQAVLAFERGKPEDTVATPTLPPAPSPSPSPSGSEPASAGPSPGASPSPGTASPSP